MILSKLSIGNEICASGVRIPCLACLAPVVWLTAPLINRKFWAECKGTRERCRTYWRSSPNNRNLSVEGVSRTSAAVVQLLSSWITIFSTTNRSAFHQSCPFSRLFEGCRGQVEHVLRNCSPCQEQATTDQSDFPIDQSMLVWLPLAATKRSNTTTPTPKTHTNSSCDHINGERKNTSNDTIQDTARCRFRLLRCFIVTVSSAATTPTVQMVTGSLLHNSRWAPSTYTFEVLDTNDQRRRLTRPQSAPVPPNKTKKHPIGLSFSRTGSG